MRTFKFTFKGGSFTLYRGDTLVEAVLTFFGDHARSVHSQELIKVEEDL